MWLISFHFLPYLQGLAHQKPLLAQQAFDHAGRLSVLTTKQQKTLVKRVEHAAERECALDINQIDHNMGRIASEKRTSYHNNVPCDDKVISF